MLATTTSGSILPCKVGMESSKIFRPANSNIVCFSYFLEITKHKAKAKPQIILRNPKLPSLGIGLRAADRYKNMVVCCVGSGPQIPNPGSWKPWLLGILMSVALPLLTGKWGPLLKLKDQVVSVLDKAESVADVVENVAERVEKVVDDIGNKLPEGKLKDALERFEDFAEDTAEVADKAGEFFDKVEDVVEDVGEKLVESSKSSDEEPKETKTVVVEEGGEEAAKAA